MMNKKSISISMIVLLVLSSSLTIPSVFAASGGSMIAIIVTTDDPTLGNDLAAYDTQYGLSPCTVTNGCLEIATPFGTSNSNPSSASDVSLYVEQAHQADPGAKILVVEAKSTSWQDKYDAAQYAESLPEVAQVSSASSSKVVLELGLVLK
jgi:subtilase family serine protease